MIKLGSRVSTLLLVVMVVLQRPALAQENDWPCAQVLVEKVSAAVIWPSPIEGEAAERWKSKPEPKSLAARFVNKYSIESEDLASIKDYFEAMPAAQRPEATTDLFLATLSAYNDKRQKYIRGIQKFTHKQKGLARRLSALLDQRDSEQTDEVDTELTDEITVMEQIFRNREGSLMGLCEQPVRLEENLGDLARAIAEHSEFE